MDLMKLKEQIINNNLNNFYVFTGTEYEIQRIYLEQMSKVLQLPITRVKSVMEAYNRCNTKTLFGTEKGFYVIRDDVEALKIENLYEKLSNIKNSYIVMLYDKLDSRLKFSKDFKEVEVAFEKLSNEILLSYTQRYLKSFSPKNTQILIDLCSGSYDLILLEIDKIKRYGEDENKSFEELLNSGVIYQPEEYSVFDFTDAVCSRKVRQSFELLNNLQRQGISSITILGTLYNSMKSVLLIQCCEGDDICGITGLDSRQVYYNKKYINKYKTNDLVRIVKLIPKVVSDIKVGKIDDAVATYYMLCKIYM